ncbi:MAG: hypothetical protein ACM3JG_13300 [Thiohalocapsa sp.]
MRTLRNALFSGVAAAALAASGAAFAQPRDVHFMTVRLPDGGLAQIRYTGNVAPQISFSEVPANDITLPVAALRPSWPGWGFDSASPFAMMRRISAEMDREAAAMFRQADALLAASPTGLTEAVARNLPPGSTSYTVVSTMSGNGVCTQSVEITATGNGQPRVVRHSSGNCGAGAALPGAGGGTINAPATVPTARSPAMIETRAHPAMPRVAPPAPAAHPDVIYTSARGARPYAGLVHEIPPAAR